MNDLHALSRKGSRSQTTVTVIRRRTAPKEPLAAEIHNARQ